MADRKKIIKGVHDARRYLEDREWVDKSVGVHIDALNDAIAFLKEQEPIEPIIKQEMDDVCSCIDAVAYCGKCGAYIGRLKPNYCHECGQEVKWDA